MPQTECPNCRKLEAQLKQLQNRIEKLEQELRRRHRQATPFSKGKVKAKPKRPGRRVGEGPFTHRELPSEEEINETHCVPLEFCPDCGNRVEDRSWHEQIQIDLPQVKPQVVRFRTQSGYCLGCGKRVRSRHPEQISQASGAAGVSIGPRAKALAADLKHRLGIPYRKISELFANGYNLEVSASGLCQADAQLAQKAQPVYHELVEAIRRSSAVYADETGWRIGVLSAWLWVFTSERITVYTIQESRAHEVVVEILGRKFGGALVSDCFTAYDAKALDGWLKQKCFAHLLREFAKLETEKTRGAVRFPQALLSVLRDALALREEKSQLSQVAFQDRVQELEQRLDAQIDAGRQFSDPDNARLAKRLRKQRAHLFTFLTTEGVEATNNRAERALRPAVITRKTGGCNRQPSGAKTHEILASLLVTVKQQGGNPLEAMIRVLTGQGKQLAFQLQRPPP